MSLLWQSYDFLIAYEFKLNASDMGSHAEHGIQNKNPVTRCCQTVNHNSKRRH